MVDWGIFVLLCVVAERTSAMWERTKVRWPQEAYEWGVLCTASSVMALVAMLIALTT